MVNKALYLAYLWDMEYENVLEEVIQLAGKQFRRKKGENIAENTTASDIASWNSLSHVMLMASIENYYGIKFDLLQMADMKSIGDIALATQLLLK